MHTLYVGVTSQDDASAAPPRPTIGSARAYKPLKRLEYGFHVKWNTLRRGVNHRRWMHLHTEPSTFPAYGFTGYSVDGKPAISSFQRTSQRLRPLLDCLPLFAAWRLTTVVEIRRPKESRRFHASGAARPACHTGEWVGFGGAGEPRAAVFAVGAAGIFIFGLPTKVRCGRAKGR